jgi:hypothetical protein
MPRRKKGTTTEEAERLVAPAREATEASVQVLVDLRDNAKSDTVRLQAAKTLLEYGWGKPAILENVGDQAARLSDDELEEEFLKIREGKSALAKAKREK